MSAYEKLPRDKREFVDLLVQRKCGTEAIRILKPWLKRPEVTACRWNALPEVRMALEERERVAMEDAGIRSAQVLLSLARVTHANIKDFFHPDGRTKAPHELSDAAAECVAGFEVEELPEGLGKRYRYRLRNANEAAKLLGQYQRLWSEEEVRRSGEVQVIEVVKFVRAPEPRPPLKLVYSHEPDPVS
jgi:hypothetical protein